MTLQTPLAFNDPRIPVERVAAHLQRHGNDLRGVTLTLGRHDLTALVDTLDTAAKSGFPAPVLGAAVAYLLAELLEVSAVQLETAPAARDFNARLLWHLGRLSRLVDTCVPTRH